MFWLNESTSGCGSMAPTPTQSTCLYYCHGNEASKWKYGRMFPREFSVEDAVAMRKKRIQKSRARAAATLQRRREAAWAKGSSSAE